MACRGGRVLLLQVSNALKILYGEFIHHVRSWSAKGWCPFISCDILWSPIYLGCPTKLPTVILG